MKKIIIALVLLTSIALTSCGTYSDWERTGKLVKISEKWLIIKSYEWEIQMGNIMSWSSVISEKFKFSAPKNSWFDIDSAKKCLNKQVTIAYVEQILVFWSSDTDYWIKSITCE